MSDVAFPDEVVTEAKLRLVDIPSGTFGLISLDNGRDHTRPSTFGPQGLRSLQAAIDEAAATPGIVGIGVTGKPFIFAVGADLSAIGVVADSSIIEEFAKLGHDVFRRLGELSVPTFAFVNGAAMGGGHLQHTYAFSVVDDAVRSWITHAVLGGGTEHRWALAASVGFKGVGNFQRRTLNP